MSHIKIIAWEIVSHESEWEQLQAYQWIIEETLRAKIKGGWLVKNVKQYFNKKDASESIPSIENQSMTFVPDPNHKWKIEGKS